MEKENRIYVDLHVIQTVPPSCINRDDTGSPKTATYGGVQRARVSSQSWKRAMRSMFQESFDEADLGVRTKRIVDMIAQEIQNEDAEIPLEAAEQLAKIIVKDYCKIQSDEKKGELKALFFISNKQVKNLAEFAVKNKVFLETDEKNLKTKEEKKKYTSEKSKKIKEATELFVKGHSVDIALFGRMVADNAALNADAAAQVAHSISTHRVDTEYDYFTALDDLAPKDQTGAAMIEVTEFNSSTLYRYATVAGHELYRELGKEKDIAIKAVTEFVKAFVTSMPTGKQNSFANRTLPEAVLVTVRNDQPINFVGAFENPVKAGEDGYSQASVRRLTEYADKVHNDYAAAPVKAWAVGFAGMGDRVSLLELNKALENLLSGIWV